MENNLKQKEFKLLNIEPTLPFKVKHIQGLYTKVNSDLFIDDLNPSELRQIAEHRQWYLNNKNK